MPHIEILPDNKKALIQPNQSILESSLAAEIPHVHACGGNARCSTCRVIVLDGLEKCLPRNEAEIELAEKFGFTEDVRLACQTKVSGDIKVRRPVLDEIDIEIISSNSREGLQSIGDEQEATMMFSDIENYTAFTEVSQPYDVVHFLNRYYHYMGKIVQKHGGYIMDYYGDGFLAIFGIENKESHALDAMKAGFEMFEEMKKMNPSFEHLCNKEFNIRLGVNTGKVILGNIGYSKMRKLAAIGDVVNMASRIESANKDLKTRFLIAESTYEQVKNQIEVGDSFQINAKGKTGKYTVYEARGLK